MKVFYLFHSGILVETLEHQLFFDVISDIDEFIDKSKDIYFFLSHSHNDHFSESIFRYRNGKTQYIISSDAGYYNGALMVNPDESRSLNDLDIMTFSSTDRGVSFMVRLKGRTLFHSGDLNWWHWENDAESVQKKEASDFKRIVSSIPNEPIDIAFIPVDPRLKQAYMLAAEYFLKNRKIRYLVPIHFSSNFYITVELKNQLNGDERIITVKKQNELLLEL